MKKQDKAYKAVFIDENQINDLLIRAKSASQKEAREIIQKGKDAKGLTPYETAVLLQNERQANNKASL
ncbi:MAG: hypothetical protein MZV70_58335 [Desulfobacterales bacterium]|nr:hypothetical protein [Desulfobacterales bacterium]